MASIVALIFTTLVVIQLVADTTRLGYGSYCEQSGITRSARRLAVVGAVAVVLALAGASWLALFITGVAMAHSGYRARIHWYA